MILKETVDVWTRLQKETKPIVMYGTGNGADKLFRVFQEYGIQVDDIFVSPEFYRGQTFRDYSCLTYQDIKKKYEDCVIVLAFAIFREDMMTRVKGIAKDYEVLAPEVPVFGTDYFSIKELDTYRDEIDRVYDLLADEQSKMVFEDLLNYRISGKIEYALHCETPREELFQNILTLGIEESYLDLGAYRGDTIEEFLSFTENSFSAVYALEPDEKNFRKMEEYLSTLPGETRSKINCYPYASWKEKAILSFDGGGGRNSSLGEGKRTVEATDLDSLLDGTQVTYIKMDVEGAEKETLEGLKHTLKQWQPKLAVSAYHRTGDLFLLPLQIKDLNENYRIYLRHHPYLPAWETNYYCI